MKKTHLSVLLYVFSVFALMIAIYQFADKRVFDGVLSLIFSGCFLFGGIYNNRKIKKD